MHNRTDFKIFMMDKVRINYFLNKTKKKKVDKDAKRAGSGSDVNTAVQEMMQEKVTTLMGKKNLRAVRQIVNRHLESQPWAKDAKAKVWTCFLTIASRL